MRLITFIFIFMYWDSTAIANSNTDRYDIIGVITQSDASGVIVLRDNELNRTLFINAGEKIPGSNNLVASFNEHNKVIITDTDKNVSAPSYTETKRPDSPETGKSELIAIESLSPKKEERDSIDGYYKNYLKDQGYTIVNDAEDKSKSIIAIPQIAGKNISGTVKIEEVIE